MIPFYLCTVGKDCLALREALACYAKQVQAEMLPVGDWVFTGQITKENAELIMGFLAQKKVLADLILMTKPEIGAILPSYRTNGYGEVFVGEVRLEYEVIKYNRMKPVEISRLEEMERKLADLRSQKVAF